MKVAQQIVETLLEGDDEKGKGMPDWLKKKISGKKADDAEDGKAADDDGDDDGDKADKPKKSSTASDVAGGPKEKGVGKAKDGEGKVEHTF